MITKKLIDSIEGEASLYFDIKDNKVDFTTIAFPHFRGMEDILKDKSALDALVYTPRVCGICGHSHLLATVRALEDAYKNAGYEIKLSQKAKTIREFTWIMELIQNHFKWIYMVLIPELSTLNSTPNINNQLKGAYASSIATKAIAIFGGQWPHSSYMLPGGVTSDPTYVDKMQAKNILQELKLYFEKECIGITIEEFLTLESCKDFNGLESDISKIEKSLISAKMHEKGFGHDRFVILGEHSFITPDILKHTRSYVANESFVSTTSAYSPEQTSYAKNALYKDEYYEGGPLSRMMSIKLPIIKNMHRRYKDSAYTRVMARIFELSFLIKEATKILNSIDILEDSYIKPHDIKTLCGSGVGIVEAPRGPLIHKVDIEDGIIKNYKIITPTQFNIGSSSKNNPTPAQKAMMGVDKKDAVFIFRTFDVCSVCTTH